MSGQLHWWPAAVSFGLGMALTLALVIRPSKLQMPAWVFADPKPGPVTAPPVMKVPSSEAPTQRIPVATARPKKKSVPRGAPRKRRPVSADAVTERIPVAGKRPAKKVPAKKVRPRGPARRIPKDSAREEGSVTEPLTVQLPLVPYAPYGPGSMRADVDGTGPEGWPVKGRTDSRLFYTPEDPGYDEIEAQVWFENQDFAARAFFMPGRNSALKNEPDADPA